MTLAIWALAIAVVLHAWSTRKMGITRNAFLASIAASMATMATSLTTISQTLAEHPANGDSEFDPDGQLQQASDSLATFASQMKTTADALNPATPGGVNDPDNGGSGQVDGGAGGPLPPQGGDQGGAGGGVTQQGGDQGGAAQDQPADPPVA